MPEPARQPHIIFLLASQLRCDVLNPYSGKLCPTPKLQLLADRASIFERHFTPCPLGIPARASLLTGLAPHQHGALINGWLPSERRYGTIRDDLPLLPQRLAESGYRATYAGIQYLWANPDFQRRQPSVQFLGPASIGEHHEHLRQRGLMIGDLSELRDPIIDYEQNRPVIFSGSSTRTRVFPLREDLFCDHAIAQAAIDAIDAHKPLAHRQPLALFCSFWLPHPPLWAPRKWATLIDPNELPLPADVGRWYRGTPALQLANIPGQLGAHVSEDAWRQAWAMYLGMTAMLDQLIGSVLAAVDKAHMLDNALVIFTSDHGEMLGSRRLFQKMCMYDPALRVPLIIKAPNQNASRRVWDLTDHPDLTSTILDYAGLRPMPQSPGLSLRLFVQGHSPDTQRRYLFATYDGNAGRGFPQRMVRSRTHKLIHNINDQAELYDLVDDPRETNNLLGQPAAASAERELRQALNTWMDEHNDPLPRC